ncbi:uncharacterized protein LOC127278788 [Leptopilina boulardi]|uniref:uncharacterized protein LOC127278788 n=1 Tax=Leptopilina boulardi TaxID=63433 RepID=UPI0021F679D5|nr:uncharacterized protein LOC127278788 [Leptopilina boulardi]
MTGEDTELCGFIDAKLPGNKGVSQKVKKRSLAGWKAWKRHWCAVRKLNGNHGIEIVLDYSIGSAKSVVPNEKDNRIKISTNSLICRTESKTKQFSFGIFTVKDKKPLLYLSGASETDTQRWMENLRQLLRPRKHRFMEGSLSISIIDNAHSKASGLTGLHGDLIASNLGVFIKDAHSGEIVQNFEWKEFNEFHLSTNGRPDDVKRICVIHTTKEFRGGVGELYIFCLNAQRLLQDFVTQGRGPKHKIFAQRPLSRSEGDLRISIYNDEDNHSFPTLKSKATSSLINAGLGLILSSKTSRDIEKLEKKIHTRAIDNVYESEPASSNPNFVASFDQLKNPCPKRVSNISIASGIYEEIVDDGKGVKNLIVPSHLYEDPEDVILNSDILHFQPPPLPPRHQCGSNSKKNGSPSDDGLDSEGGTRSATPNTQSDTTPTPEEIKVINPNLIDTSDYVPMSPCIKITHKSEELNTSQEGVYMVMR